MMVSVPTSLTVAIPVDGGAPGRRGFWRLHLREKPGAGPTLCALPVLEGDVEASAQYPWSTDNGTACSRCYDALELLDDESLLRWRLGYGI